MVWEQASVVRVHEEASVVSVVSVARVSASEKNDRVEMGKLAHEMERDRVQKERHSQR